MLLLGIDEGTTGVKAALFDERLRPVGEARRDKVNRHPQAGWVEQDGEEVLAAVVEAVAELLEGAGEEVVACGLDHQGESVLAWDAETGAPLSPIVVWQDKRSQEVLDRLGSAEERGPRAERPALRPLFLRGQARLAAGERLRRGGGPRRGHPAHGHGRLLPLRPAGRRLCHRRLHRLSHPAARAGAAGLRRPPGRDLRRAARRAARGARHRRRAGRAAPRVVARRAAPAGSGGGPAGGAGRRRLRGSRTGEGHLRHRRLRAQPRRR